MRNGLRVLGTVIVVTMSGCDQLKARALGAEDAGAPETPPATATAADLKRFEALSLVGEPKYKPGFKHLEGKEAFDGEIENDAFEGRPALEVDRLIEEAATVVAIGTGRSRRKDGTDFRFAFADVFTFRGGGVSRVESYVVPLDQHPSA